MLGLNALWSPGAAFAEVRESATGRWLWPAVMLTVLVTVIGAVHVLRIDIVAETRELIEASLAESGQEVPPELDRMLPAIAYGQIAFGVLVFPLTLLIIGFVGWLNVKIWKGEGTFGQALGVTVRAKMPALLLTVIGVVIALLMAEPPGLQELATVVKHHPAALLGTDIQSPWFTLSAFFGIFPLWTLALLVLGSRDALKVAPLKSALTYGGLYVLLALGLTGMALAGQAAQSLG
jgi:hypothetical protein